MTNDNEEIKVKPDAKLPPDYAKERLLFLTDWEELVDIGQPLGKQIYQIFRACTELPDPELQLPILTAFAMMPTAIINIAPIAIAHGQSGTGKSDIGVIVSSLYDAPVLPASTTRAGLRNHIKLHKYYDPTSCRFEKHLCVVFDDLSPATLNNNEPLFTMLKTSCNRKTSGEKIALPGGETLQFDTFCTKFLTSIHSFWEETNLLELKRRSIIFRTAKSKNYSAVDPKEIDFGSLPKQLDGYWGESLNREVFRERYKRTGKHPQRELLATLSTVLMVSIAEAKELFDAFEKNSSFSEIGDPLQEFIKSQIELNNFDRIFTQNVKVMIAQGKEQGILDKCSVTDFNKALKSLGWVLVKSQTQNNNWYWTRRNDD